MEKVKDAIIRELNNSGMPSIALPKFALSMSAVITSLAASVLKEDIPQMAMARKPVNEMNLMKVMGGADMLRHYKVYSNVSSFLSWLYEQKTPDADDYEQMWYDISYVGEKWNEWLKEKTDGTETEET